MATKKIKEINDKDFIAVHLAKKFFLPDYISEAINTLYASAVKIWHLSHINKFTDHSIGHSRRILDYALQISNSLESPLTKHEILYLVAACLFHDIGMQHGHYGEKSLQTGEPLEDWDNIRKKHADYSIKILKGLFGDKDALDKLKGVNPELSSLKDIFNKNKINTTQFIETLSIIILSHTKDSRRREHGWFMACQPVKSEIRIDLLAALLRLGDELDLNKNRISDMGIFAREEIPLDSLQYWLSSAFISKVEVKELTSGILINIIPDYSDIPNEKDLADFVFFLIYYSYKKLARSLIRPIIPGMNTMSDIFSKNGINVRVNNLDYETEVGFYDQQNSVYYEALHKSLNRLVEKGFETDIYYIKLFDFPKIQNTRVCLIEEADGLRFPPIFKEQIVSWVNDRIAEKLKYHKFHTCFHRLSKKSKEILEYLPDKRIAPHSILGAAAATRSFGHDIPSLTLLPDKIECDCEFQEDSVIIHFPKLSRSNLEGNLKGFNNWEFIDIKYVPPGGRREKSIVYAVAISLGETIFLVIPSDQSSELSYELRTKTMTAAGISNFFSGLPLDGDIKLKKKWKKARENLLTRISENFKKQYNITKNTICSIVGYIDTKKQYKIIAWRDFQPRFPDYIHVGIIASSYFFLDKETRNRFKAPPLSILDENFPKDNSINIELWGDDSENIFNTHLDYQNRVAVTIDVKKSIQLLIHRDQ